MSIFEYCIKIAIYSQFLSYMLVSFWHIKCWPYITLIKYTPTKYKNLNVYHKIKSGSQSFKVETN